MRRSGVIYIYFIAIIKNKVNLLNGVGNYLMTFFALFGTADFLRLEIQQGKNTKPKF